MSDEMMVIVSDVESPAGVDGSVGVLDAETAGELVKYLDSELKLAWDERSEKRKKWQKWRRQRDGEPENKVSNYPFKNAANVVPPLASILTKNMYAYVHSSFTIREPGCSIKSIQGTREDIEGAKVLEEYLGILEHSPFDLNLDEVKPVIEMEGTSMGTSFVKVPYTIDKASFKTEDDEGNLVDAEIVQHDGPEWVPIPAENVLYRESVQDVQRAPWVAHLFSLTESEVVNRGLEGIYEGVDGIMNSYRTEPTEADRDVQMRIGINQEGGKVWDFAEVYVRMRIPDTRYLVDLLVIYHPMTKTLMRARYNTLGWRPIEPVKYMFRPYYLDGKGVGWMTEQMQDEVETIHRMRLNSAHFASLRMLAVKRTAGLKGKEELYPGKLWKVDDPSRDIVPIQMGEIYPSEIQAEQMAWHYAQQDVGFSDAQRGFSDMVLKSGASTSLQMFNAQQGGKLINSITSGMVNSFSRLYLYTVLQLIRNRARVINNEKQSGRLSPEKIQVLDRVLSIPITELPKRLKFTVRTTDMDKTFEVRRQNTLTLIQIYSMFWEKILPLAMPIYDPKTPPPIKEMLIRALTGSTRLLEKTMKFFGEDDTDRFVPDYKRLEAVLDIKKALEEAAGGMRNVTGGAEDEFARGAIAGGAGAAAFAGAAQGPAGGGSEPAGFERVGNRSPNPPRPAGGPGPIGA